MKFLQIGENAYINVERIDGLWYKKDRLKVFVGGSEYPWSVSESYAEQVLAWVNDHLDDKE